MGTFYGVHALHTVAVYEEDNGPPDIRLGQYKYLKDGPRSTTRS